MTMESEHQTDTLTMTVHIVTDITFISMKSDTHTLEIKISLSLK